MQHALVTVGLLAMTPLRVDATYGPFVPDVITPANLGAFEGGPTGLEHDTQLTNVVRHDEQTDNGGFNMPSNGPPSPLFGASPFSSPLLRFEEFGNKAFDPLTPGIVDGGPDGVTPGVSTHTLPVPPTAESCPNTTSLDEFLSQPLTPLPLVQSNTGAEFSNPWRGLVEEYLGHPISPSPPVEGRPGGQAFAHQRWSEFRPKEYVNTATTGARENFGLRDASQRHAWAKETEFDPKHGLYGKPSSLGKGTTVQFHPGWPVQDPDAMWTFDGTFPPKLLQVRYGHPVVFRHHNALPVNVTSNRGAGIHTLTTHEHNGHTPAESDGYTNAFFFPGQFYDYRWPMALAGHDSINVNATDPRAATPDGVGGTTQIRGDWRETMSTHWFHDHMLDFTAQNVYKGSMAMMNYYSALDRGNEAVDDGVNLRLPSGTHLDWGNRDYDVNLVLADKAFDSTGQLWFNPYNQLGFLGDVMTVNFCYKPWLAVRARRYRFRILDGSVSRFFKVALVHAEPPHAPVPFYMVANDGNIMEHAVHFPDGTLPVVGIAERYDIVADFAGLATGTKLWFVNLLGHKTGKVTDRVFSVAEALAHPTTPVVDPLTNRYSADPVVGPFLELRVDKSGGQADKSMDPADYVEGRKSMVPLRRPSEEELASATHRTFEFEKDVSPGEPGEVQNPWGIGTDGGQSLKMDATRVSVASNSGPESPPLEVWRLINSGTWSHPIHIHFEEGIILRRDGKDPPPWEKWARKDVFRLGPQPESGTMVEIAYRFRDFAGTYMMHCHNTQHEDHAMLLRWDIEKSGQLALFDTPVPTWAGVGYVGSHGLGTTFRTGEEGGGEVGPAPDPVDLWVRDATFGGFDFANEPIGDALTPTSDERGWVKMSLQRGYVPEHDRYVYFVLHDISDPELADEFGVLWAGKLVDTPRAAMGLATYSNATDAASLPHGVRWVFDGDLPNPVPPSPGQLGPTQTVPPQLATNTYSPLRQVTLQGRSDVVVNAFFVQWGDEPWEKLRVDEDCTSFPDDPPNTACMYNGEVWGQTTGHALAIDIPAPGEDPAGATVTLKLHKSWAEEGDYVSFYVVVDTFPLGPANAMGIPFVPKHQYLRDVAVPLIQFLPGEKLRPSYPPTEQDGFGLSGGGPLGGQIGVPSYFMPEDDYSPMWHIGFAHWEHAATEVVKSLKRVLELRDGGHVTIREFPPVGPGRDDFNLTSLAPVHVVNCPIPLTIDGEIHKARAIYNRLVAARSAAALLPSACVCQNYAVHARTTVTFDGASTTVHGGDVSVSPGTAITGSPQLLTGEIVADSADFAAAAQAAHAASLGTIGGDPIALEMGGLTFTPGIYTSDSTITLASGSVTLDGRNDPHPTFLFQAATTLVTGANTFFVLTNGAKAENIVWALGTGATLGANSVLEGSILAGTAITFGAHAELRGCALAQSAVTFKTGGSVRPYSMPYNTTCNSP